MFSKYHAKKTTIDGITFDSQMEAKRYLQLKDMGVENLQRQVAYVLIDKSKYGREIKYVADFVYDLEGSQIVEDVKGFRTPVYSLKKRMMAERYDIVISEYPPKRKKSKKGSKKK